MEFLKTYVRNLLGLGGDQPTTRASFKRDRIDDELSDDEDPPAYKRLRALKKTTFPDIMPMNDNWENSERYQQKVRYVPIQFEAGHPSTSTPNLSSEKLGSRVRSVPIKLVDISEKSEKSARKPRMHTPVRPVIHAVIDDDDDDDDQEVTWVESKPQVSKKSKPKVYIDLEEDEENECHQPDDVVFVKKITTPPPVTPYKFFVTKTRDVTDSEENRSPQYYRLLKQRKLVDRNATNTSPKTYSKFKAPAGISKAHKKSTTPMPRWMLPLSTSNNVNLSQARNKYLNMNGNARSAISEVFNLDEKRNYQELIRRVAGSVKPASYSKALETINLDEEAQSFRSTQKSQKKALDEINFVERGLNAHRDVEAAREYDPLTVASINSSDSEVEIVPSESSASSTMRIIPVNSLRDSFKDRSITSEDWLAKLDSKYKKKRRDTQEKLKDARRENDIISKVNYEQKLAHLENKLKYELSIPESLIEEAQPTVELPELTPEQEKLVNRALGPGPPGQLLVEKFNLRIHRRDLQTLAGLNWLNDEVINFYMNLLMQRSQERSDLPKVYAANTFFYPKLMQGGQAGLKRWTRRIDIFAHDLMVVPVHLGVHWCLSLVDFRKKRVSYLDSMGGRNQPCVDALLQYLHDEHKDKKGQPFDSAGWKTECLSKDIPQQMNGSDCGMFSCTFAEFSARDAPYTFSQQHMPYLRRKAALEILQGKLML